MPYIYQHQQSSPANSVEQVSAATSLQDSNALSCSSVHPIFVLFCSGVSHFVGFGWL